MAYQTNEHAHCREIEDAREHVADAQRAHARGAHDDVVNHANKRLAYAHEALRTHHAGIVLTGRDADDE